MKKFLFLVSLSVILSLNLGYCDNPKLYLPSSKEVNGLNIAKTLMVRSDTELFEYMDGGAEIYRAFNFRKLAVRQFETSDSDLLVVELYMFKKPEDAYGMYHMLPDAEKIDVGSEGGYEIGVMRFWKGFFFCKVYISDRNWESAKDLLIRTAKAVAEKIPEGGNPPEMVKIMPREDLKKGGIHYFYEYIALKNLLYITYSNILNLTGDTEVVMGEYSSMTAEDATFLAIKYPTEEECIAAYNQVVTEYLHEKPGKNFSNIIKKLDSTVSVEIEKVDNYLLFGRQETTDTLMREKFQQLLTNMKSYSAPQR